MTITWGNATERLTREWQMLKEYEPEFLKRRMPDEAVTFLRNMQELEREVEVAIDQFCLGHNWLRMDEELRPILFLRVDFAMRAASEMPSNQSTEMDFGNTMQFLLIHAWHDAGYKNLIDHLNSL